MKTDRYNYAVTFSAEEGYPNEVHFGYLTDENNEIVAGVPKVGSEKGPWQYNGSKGGQGGNIIPSHFRVVYASYADKKFYEVKANLPKDKITQLFKEGFEEKGLKDEQGNRIWNQTTYEAINIGAAPGGVVVVWLTGNHRRTEVGRFQAEEVFVDVNDFYQNADEENNEQFFNSYFDIVVPENTKKLIAEQGIPYGLWDKYRIKYNYRFVLKSYDETDYITQIYRINFNGETEYLKDKEAVAQYKLDGVPSEVSFVFVKYFKKIEFNNLEVLEAFEKLSKLYPNEPIDFVIKPEFMYKDYKVFVQCKETSIELKELIKV